MVRFDPVLCIQI